MTIEQHRLDDAFALGDVVTLQDRVELMTVEGVRVTGFGVMLDCCWFDRKDGLRYSRFPTQSVNVFPRPQREPALKIGTEVRLRSRGPVMTIRGFRTKSGTRYAICAWSGAMGRERQRLFPVQCLTLTLLERFEPVDRED